MRKVRWLTLLVAVFALAIPPLGADASTMTIVMRNLNNPRGLNFGATGALYVAEAGTGGTQQCFVGPEGQEFAGSSGSISRLWRGAQERVVTGLPSHAAAGGFGALGPHDVLPRGNGRIDFTIGLGTDPAERAACLPAARYFGWLARATANDAWRPIVDVAAFEVSANPDRGAVDSNPYGLLSEVGGDDEGRTIATDAGGNSLVAIRANGSITALATFPSRSSGRSTDSVPTTVARGPDGALYVGELTGFPFVPGTANVYRIANGAATAVLTGFSFIVDMTFGADGSLYVLEFASGAGLSGPGNLWRVMPATASGTRTLIATGLVTPTAVAIGSDGAFYVSNCGVFPAGNRTTDPPPCQAGGGGHVLRVTP
jgi:hypothetical protein